MHDTKHVLEITVLGDPIAKQRSRQGGSGHWYNPQEHLMIKVSNIIRDKLPENHKMIEKGYPIKCIVSVFFSIPKSWTKKKIKQLQEKGEMPCLNKKDVDNIAKFYMDVMSKKNAAVYYDDNQIYSLTSDKYYTATESRVEITIMW
jgi:Holliday junction resolvase RusA-like endonuclease